MTHVALQDTVVQVLGLLGWRHLHVRRSIGKGRQWVTTTSVTGWPDLYCWHEAAGRQLAIELKVPPDRLTAEQAAVLASLATAGVEVAVWVPADLPRLGELLDPRAGPLSRAMVRASVLPPGRNEL